MATDEDGRGCELCGLPLAGAGVTNADGDAFCCAGCRDVHAALGDVDGVEADDVREAVGDGESDRGDAPPGHERTFFRVDGMHCTTCEAFVESVATATDGVDGAEASYVTETVRVDHDPDRATADDLREALSTAGYTATPREDATDVRRDEAVRWRLAAGVLFGMWVMMPYVVYIYPVHFGLYPPWMLELARQQIRPDGGARYFYYLLFWFTSLVLFVTGGPILRGAYVSLRARRPNMDLLVGLAAVSAYLYSTLAVFLGRIDVYYDVTVAIVVVVTAGNYYESSVKREATDLLSDVHAARTDEARVRRSDGSTATVDVSDLDPGDGVLVRAGERVPVDGAVREGEGTADEAVVTGESLPVGKRRGDEVVGGSVLTDGAVVVEVGEDATSSVERIAGLMWNLQSSSRGVQRLADALAVVFVPGVLTLAAVAGVASAVLVALTVLLVSCPCALGLATPLAVAAGVRDAVERGIVVFDETVFERVREVDVVAFDKTGTLTTGDLRVLEADAPGDLLRAAAALERRSTHPVADAVAAAFDVDGRSPGAEDRGDGRLASDGGASDGDTGEAVAGGPDRAADARRVSEFRRHALGVEGVVDGEAVLVGHPDLFAERGWSVPDAVGDRAADARDAGRLPVVVGRGGAAEGLVVLRDEPRDGWDETVTGLSERGVEVVILTGDDRTASEFRDHPGVERVFAGVPPEAKAETVRRLGADRRVAMVGDGTNDGPALAGADLGIALGSGTALAVDAADVAIVDDDLASVETTFDLSRAARRRVRQNVAWAFGYNAVAVPLAVAGVLNPLFATVAMATSSLLVVTNSSRSLLEEPPGEGEP
ncbi:MAG: heavy metal translocating P-type ATPase [Halobacteriaceae archaeon]